MKNPSGIVISAVNHDLWRLRFGFPRSMGHKSILAESAYPDSGLEFSKYMNGKISRAEIICFPPGFLCKFAGIFYGSLYCAVV